MNNDRTELSNHDAAVLFALWNLRGGSQLSESGRTFVRLGGQVELVFLDDTVLTRPGQEELPAWSVGRRLAEVLGRGYVMWRATVRAPVRILLGRDAAGSSAGRSKSSRHWTLPPRCRLPLLVRAPSAAGPSASYSEIPAEPPGRAFDDMNLPEMAFSISLRAIDNERAAEAFLLLAQLGVREPPHQFNRSFYLPTPTGGDTQIAIPDSRVLVAPGLAPPGGGPGLGGGAEAQQRNCGAPGRMISIRWSQSSGSRMMAGPGSGTSIGRRTPSPSRLRSVPPPAGRFRSRRRSSRIGCPRRN